MSTGNALLGRPYVDHGNIQHGPCNHRYSIRAYTALNRTLEQVLNGPEDIAAAYLGHFATKRKDDAWAVTEVDDLIRRDAVRGWEVTRALVQKAESDEALAYIAAGPLEDL